MSGSAPSKSRPARRLALLGLLCLALQPSAFATGGAPPPPGCGGWRSPPDTDADGIAGEQDLCPSEPEDVDGFQDGDGCPDRDNDEDGVPDPADPCPVDAEDLDGVLDGDGCPDVMGTLRLMLDPPGGREVGDVELTARALFGQEAPDPPTPKQLSFPAGAPVRAELHAGLWAVRVRAEGFADYSLNLEVPSEAELTVNLALQPAGGVAQVRLDIRDHRGVPVSGVSVQLGKGTEPMPAPRGLLETTMAAGSQVIVVRAPGFQESRERVDLVAGELRELHLQLSPMPLVSQEGDRLVLRKPLGFAPGTDALRPEAYESLDALAKWLLENPDTGLLRVEVHTANTGDTVASLRLSQRQAEAITRALADRGVPDGALYAVGFGDSSPLVSPLLPDAAERNERVELVIERGGGGR